MNAPMDTLAISKALMAWMESQQINAGEAVIAMLTLTADSLASNADTPAILAASIGEAQGLLIKRALQSWLAKRNERKG